MRPKLSCAIAALTLAPLLGVAAESGTVIKSSELKSKPFNDAKTLTTLNKGVAVEILGRDGGWNQVRAGKNQGWLRMLNIRRSGAAAKTDVAAVTQVATGRAATGNIASTTGIRGLSEEDLKNAPFNEAQVKLLESHTVTADQARQFASQHQRKARQVESLPNPSKS